MQSLKDDNNYFLELYDEFHNKWADYEKEVKALRKEL